MTARRKAGRGMRLKRMAATGCAIMLLLNTMLMIFSSACAAQSIGTGDYFEYEYVQKVTSGTGIYYGYWDRTTSNGRYDVLSVSGDEVTMHASYAWNYASQEGANDQGAINTDFTFSMATRKYTQGYDLDEPFGLDPGIWLWVSPDVARGDVVSILDDYLTVESTDGIYWSGTTPLKAIVLVSKGTGYRDDEYGIFSYTYEDRYYMDRTTGFIICEEYIEHDRGSWAGISGTFTYKETTKITSASYTPPISYLYLIILWVSVIGIILLISLGCYLLRWRTRRYRLKGHVAQIRIYRIRKIGKFPLLSNEASKYFEPFLKDFAEKTILSGGRVAVATSSNSIVGLAMYHKESRVGTIICKDYGLNERMRSYIGTKDFFSEVRHTASDVQISAAEESAEEFGYESIDIPKEAYNVFETYKIMKLDETRPVSYDHTVVKAMCPEDIREVSRIAEVVYKVKSVKWIRGVLNSGDIALVAKINDRISGFAFATVVDNHARFHTLTVSPEMRGKGIGKELMRARLHMVSAMGVEDVVSEIADWNLPSLSISGKFGFREIGPMYVETTRIKRVKKDIMRR